MFNPKRQAEGIPKDRVAWRNEMAAGPSAVMPIPKMTVRFENDPLLFSNVTWIDFYRHVVELVNDAAREHGDGFSVLFGLPYAHSTELPAYMPYASIKWHEKSVLLSARPSGVTVWLEAGDMKPLCTYQNDDWHKAWSDVLAPLLLDHFDWKIHKARKALEQAIAEKNYYQSMPFDD